MEALKADKIIETVRGVLLKDRSVRWASLFGSLAVGRETSHDVDIALLLDIKDSRERVRRLALLTVEIAEALGLSEERVDVVDLEGASLALKKAALSGICLINSLQGAELRERLLREYPDFLLGIKSAGNWDLDPEPDMALIQSRIEELRKNADYLKEEVCLKPLKALLKSYKDVLALERASHRMIGAMLDVCRHVVSVHNLGLVESYGEIPREAPRCWPYTGRISTQVKRACRFEEYPLFTAIFRSSTRYFARSPWRSRIRPFRNLSGG
jgi:predicted nucleotidyltransferase